MGSIWTRSPHEQYTLRVGGPNLSEAQFAAPWEAYSVVVANRTNQHLHMPDINWWFPPGIVGAVMPVPALMQATAAFEPPPGLTDPPAVAGQLATLDFFAEELAPSSGVATPLLPSQVGLQQPTVNGTLVHDNDQVAMASGGLAFVTFSFIPLVLTGTGRLNFEGSNDGSNWIGLPWLPLVGAAGGWQSGLIAGPLGIAGLIVEVACGGIQQVRVRLNTGGTESVPVVVTGNTGGTSMPFGQQSLARSLPVAIASDQAIAIVSSDTVLTQPFNVALGAGATQDLVAAVAGQKVYCLALNFQVITIAANEVDLQDDVPTVIGALGTHATSGPGTKWLFGRAGTVGHKVQLKNTGAGAAGQLIGELVYVQK